MSPTIFVCGATGTQGGAVARHLLTTGATVHALARDPTTPKAKALASLGVKLWHGDFDNAEALAAALAGTQAVFLNFMPDFTDLGANLRQADLIMRTAAAAGATHAVYSSGIGIDRADEFEFFDKDSMLAALLASKVDIERAVRSSSLPTHTVLRPGNFMANYVDPFARMQVSGLADTGRWTTALQPGVVLPLVDTATIGAVSAAALLDPARFHGVTLSYADEMLTMGEIVSKLAAVTGRDLQMVPMTDEDIDAQKATNPFVGGQLAMRSMAKFIDMDEFKAWNFPLSSFDKYLEREKEAVKATYLKSA
ncbi:hypothetical protein ACO1O0_005291 [Amphichorda felina]